MIGPRGMRWILWLLAAASAGTAAVLFIDRVVIPSSLRSRLKAGVEEALRRKAEARSIRFSPFRGLRVVDFRVYDSDGTSTLFRAESVGISIDWFLFLKSGKVAVSRALVSAPELNLSFSGERGFNLYDVFSSSAVAAGPAAFTVRRVKVVRGLCRFRYGSDAETLVENVDGEVRRAPGGGASFEAEGALGDGRSSSGFTARGSCGPGGSLKALVRVDRLPLPAAAGYLRGLPVSLDAEGSGPVAVSLDSSPEGLRMEAYGSLRGLSVEKEGYRLRGDAAVVSTIAWSPALDRTAWSVVIAMRGGRVEPRGWLPAVEGVDGAAVFDEKGFSAGGVRLSVLGLPLTLDARMDGYESPVYSIRLNSGIVDLKDLPRVGEAPVRLSGDSRLSLSLRGKAEDLARSLRGSVEFRGAQAASALGPLKGISGRVAFTAEAARWKGVRFLHAGRAYSSSGSLLGFESPRIEASVSGRRSSIALKARLSGSRLGIESLRGRGPDVQADLKGEIDASRKGATRASLGGAARVQAEDVEPWLAPRAAAPLRRAGLRGWVRVEGTLAGTLERPRDLRARAKVRVEGLEAYGVRVDSGSFDLRQEGRRLVISRLEGRGCSGSLSGESQVGLSSSSAHETRFQVRGLDLSRLPRRLGLSGVLDLEGELKGPLDRLDRASGKAELRLRNARLFHFPLMGRLGDILFGRKNNETVFSQASGRFQLSQGTLSSEGITLGSDQMVLRISGKAALGGALDILVESRFNERLLIPTLDVKKIAARLAGSLGLLVCVHIGGTADKPEYAVLPSPVGWLKRLADSLGGS
jgi:hypothetical protein